MDYEQFLATGSPKPVPWPLRDEEELLSLNYTSGTTGKPKGVMIIHRGAYLNAIGQVIEGGATAGVKYLWTLPMFHCNGWCYTWAITAVGATHICLRKFDPAKVWQLIESEGVTHLSGSPNMFTVLLNHPDRPKAFKQPLIFGIGGSQPSPGLIARSQELGIRVIHGYGLTETYGRAQFASLSPSGKSSRRAKRRPSWPPGRAFHHGRCCARRGRRYARHPARRQKPRRGGDAWCHRHEGYYKEPEATARDFRGGWFHSGDLAVVHPDGYIELRDRLRDIIVVGGDNVSANELEQALASHPAVAEVAVVGVPHERWGETPKAFVILKEGAQIKARQLIHFCREHLAVSNALSHRICDFIAQDQHGENSEVYPARTRMGRGRKTDPCSLILS